MTIAEEKQLAVKFGAKYSFDSGRGGEWGLFKFPHGYEVWMASATRWMVAAVVDKRYCRHRAFETLERALKSAKISVDRLTNRE